MLNLLNRLSFVGLGLIAVPALVLARVKWRERKREEAQFHER